MFFALIFYPSNESSKHWALIMKQSEQKQTSYALSIFSNTTLNEFRSSFFLNCITINMSYSTEQQLALTILPKLSGTISIFSSLFIMSEILHDYRSNDMNPIKRALLGVTCFEVFGALGWILTGWALPKESGFVISNGSMASCNFQGFLLQMVVGAPMFS
jgi:hypothetical protein